MRRIKEVIITALLVLLTGLIAIGCSSDNMEHKAEELVSVSLGATIQDSSSKSLSDPTGVTDTTIKYFKYYSKAQFSSANTTVHGNMSTYGSDEYDDVSKISLTLSQGMWDFYLAAYNEAGDKIYEGSALNESITTSRNFSTNPISITLYPCGEADGSIAFDLTAAVITTGSHGTLSVYYTGPSTDNVETQLSSSSITYGEKDSNVTMKGTITDLKPGFYKVRYLYEDGSLTAGGERTYAVFNGASAKQEGSLDGQDFAVGKNPITVTATLANNSLSLSKSSSEAAQVNTTVTFKASGLGSDQAITWNVNGITVQTAPTEDLSFTFSKPGTYTIGASVEGTNVKATEITINVSATYTIYFDANEGTVTKSSDTVTYGSAYPTFPTPQRAGYHFDGWYTAKTGGSAVSGNYDKTDDLTLYAHWTANTYTVTLNANGGSGGKTSIEVTYGGTYSDLYATAAKPSRTGYIFVGWYASADSDDLMYSSNSTVTITGNKTFYAHWSDSAIKISYAGDDISLDADTVARGTQITLPTPTRAGYTFDKWNNTYAGGAKYTVPDTDVTLTGSWTPVTYTITFVSDGKTYATSSAAYNAKAASWPSDPKKTGYNFSAWKNSNGSKTYTNDSTFTEDTVIYANWTERTQTVTLMLEDGTTEFKKATLNMDGNYADLYSGANVPTKDDYIFNKWYTGKNSTGKKIEAVDRVTDDDTITLYASWTSNAEYYTFYCATSGIMLYTTYKYFDVSANSWKTETYTALTSGRRYKVHSSATLVIADDSVTAGGYRQANPYIRGGYTVSVHAVGGYVCTGTFAKDTSSIQYLIATNYYSLFNLSGLLYYNWGTSGNLNAWVNYISDGGTVCYDTTSTSTPISVSAGKRLKYLK